MSVATRRPRTRGLCHVSSLSKESAKFADVRAYKDYLDHCIECTKDTIAFCLPFAERLTKIWHIASSDEFSKQLETLDIGQKGLAITIIELKKLIELTKTFSVLSSKRDEAQTQYNTRMTDVQRFAQSLRTPHGIWAKEQFMGLIANDIISQFDNDLHACSTCLQKMIDDSGDFLRRFAKEVKGESRQRQRENPKETQRTQQRRIRMVYTNTNTNPSINSKVNENKRDNENGNENENGNGNGQSIVRSPSMSCSSSSSSLTIDCDCLTLDSPRMGMGMGFGLGLGLGLGLCLSSEPSDGDGDREENESSTSTNGPTNASANGDENVIMATVRDGRKSFINMIQNISTIRHTLDSTFRFDLLNTLYFDISTLYIVRKCASMDGTTNGNAQRIKEMGQLTGIDKIVSILNLKSRHPE